LTIIGGQHHVFARLGGDHGEQGVMGAEFAETQLFENVLSAFAGAEVVVAQDQVELAILTPPEHLGGLAGLLDILNTELTQHAHHGGAEAGKIVYNQNVKFSWVLEGHRDLVQRIYAARASGETDCYKCS